MYENGYNKTTASPIWTYAAKGRRKKERIMSWFKHSPPKHPPLQKHHSTPHRTSPAAERMMEEAKATSPKIKQKKSKPE
jgi:hypothetical protein